MKKLLCILILLLILFSKLTEAQDIATINSKNLLSFHGNVGASLLFYNVNGIAARSKPFSYLFSGNFNLRFAGIELPFSFVYSEQDRDFRQPFNQFGLSPKYKWITVHLGYRNVNYSSFTLGGHSILGAGIDLTPGKFRFGFMWGRFMRPVEGNSSGGALSTPSFKRKGFATKIGYGNNKRFFDIIFLKANDDSTSVVRDSTLNGLTPASNMVLGYNSHIEFAKKFVFESEGAFSSYTEDITSLKGASNDTYTKFAKSFIAVNGTTGNKTALRVSIQFKEKLYSIRLQYKRISPNFNSMGTYFIGGDIQQISLDPNFMLFKQKLNVRLSLGIQNDNLNKKKYATTQRLAESINFSYNITRFFGIDAGYSNYFTNQKGGAIALIDSTKYYQMNENITFSPHYLIVGKVNTHVIALNYCYMNLNDLNSYTEKFADYNTHNVMLNYVLNLNKHNLSLNAALNYTTMQSANFSNYVTGFALGASKSFFNNKLSVSVPLSLQNNRCNGVSGLILNASGSVGYRPFKKHSLNLTINYINNLTSTVLSPAFGELRGVLAYVFTF
jgi:hypothetical protein